MKLSASSATVGIPRSSVFWFAGSCPCATAPRMILALVLGRFGLILLFAALSIALLLELPDRRDAVAPRPSPVDDHVRFRTGGANAPSEAGHGVVPNRELVASGFKGIHRAFGDP